MPDPKLGGQWGILGGTFDPVHLGHLTLAKQIRNRRKLTGVMFVPSFAHPYKVPKTIASYDHRMAMLKLAAENYHDFVVSSIEKDSELSGYTLDTVKAVKNEFPDSEFFFLIGADNIAHISSWHRSKEIMEEVTILVGCRPRFDFEEQLKHSGLTASNFEMVKTDELAISSTEIRAMIKANIPGDNLEKMMPRQVIQYIKVNGLYL
jgi:nicotinate-nucleotide adenylyltransferase